MTQVSKFAKVGRIGRSYPRSVSFTTQQPPARRLSRAFKITGALGLIGWLLAR